MNGKEFGEWLDANGIDVAEAAAYFGVAEGSIYKWRSTPGVPERKLEWVKAQMDAYGRKAATAPELDRVVLEITDEQFAAWNDAATEAGLRLKEWAIASLDELAAQESTGSDAAPNPLRSLPTVAEPGTDYLPKKDGTA